MNAILAVIFGLFVTFCYLQFLAITNIYDKLPARLLLLASYIVSATAAIISYQLILAF